MENQPNDPQKSVETADEKLGRFVEEVNNEPNFEKFLEAFEPLSDSERDFLGVIRLSMLRGDAIYMHPNTKDEAKEIMDNFFNTGFIDKLKGLGVYVQIKPREYKEKETYGPFGEKYDEKDKTIIYVSAHYSPKSN